MGVSKELQAEEDAKIPQDVLMGEAVSDTSDPVPVHNGFDSLGICAC